jgi:catecholate siderophore receptor
LQDQVELSSRFQLIAGVRFDHFDLRYRNHRNAENLRRTDNISSPRAGLVFKPASSVSLYTSYSISFLPSAGDQFSSLTTVTQQVKPEKFTNYEAGAKWDVSRRLALTAAVYRLDRTNTRSVDPNDPARIVQTGSQETKGLEFGWNGSVTRAWRVAGGYAYQDAFVTSATVSARAGAAVAQVPRHTFSFWNRYQFGPRVGIGLGIVSRTDMFAAIDNSVVLPGYIRADGAVFYSVTERIRLQANFENLLDRRYILNADGNNNISPGSPRALRIGMTARF